MYQNSLDKIEFPRILERLAGYAAFSASKELALSLTPSASLDKAQGRLEETSQARLLLSKESEASIGGARDVRQAAASATRGIVLEPQDLLDIQSTLVSGRNWRVKFEKSSEDYPALKAIAAGLTPAPGLIDAISNALDDRGEVLERASRKLGEIRREHQVVHDRLLSRLERMLADPKVRPMLQEPIITQRDGRYVVPLRAEFKGKFKSVVHDQSSSGATLFVEPTHLVEQNNQLRQLELAERDEIRRILAELSAMVGEAAEAVESTVNALAALDLSLARARYAEVLKAHAPILRSLKADSEGAKSDPPLRLIAARHPLLDPGSVVPIDLILEDGVDALVITGPNTGGKTVALKTAGLLAAMAASGLHIPAESGSQLPLFEAIYADIGDEQSIEQSLSTFSAHISTIIRILDQADAASLVLLDELGAGTDPQEGAALALAILSTLVERGVTTLVATHFPELKAYAHTQPAVRNASAEFDLKTLKPTYRLILGLPGKSNALSIASRLGLEDAVVARARASVGEGEVEVETILEEIQRQLQDAENQRAEAEAARLEAERLQAKLDMRLETLETERNEKVEAARTQTEADLASVREEVEQLRRRLKVAGEPLEAVEEIEAELTEVEQRRSKPKQRKAAPSKEAWNVAVGDEVLVKTLDARGVVTEVGARDAEVQIGRLRLRARWEELLPLNPDGQKAASPPDTAPARGRMAGGNGGSLPMEIDIRGRTAEEAIPELESYLDAAYLAGMPYLRIVHGKGSGRLRDAVRQWLRNNPYASSFEAGGANEGGEGVTVVRLANA